MKAVIRSGGKQYLVEKGQTLQVELTNADQKKIQFDVLMSIDGDKVQTGNPVLDGVKVTAEVVGQVAGEKIKVLKFKAKKRVKRLTGHRQKYTEVKVTAIG